MIVEKQDEVLYNEAVTCFKNEAYRMAYIAGWLCIAESLKNKFKIMSERDKVADRVVLEIEKLEEEHKPSDQLILDRAKEIGLLSDVSYNKLCPFIKHRNIFAHPYNIGPRPDEVFVLLKTAIDEILSMEAYLRKPYIDKLIDNLVKVPHFLDNRENKIEDFCVYIMGKILPTLYPYLFKTTLFYLNEITSDPDKATLYWRTKIFLIKALNIISPNFNEGEWQLEKKSEDFIGIISDVFLCETLFPKIPEPIQDRIVLYVTNAEIKQSSKELYIKRLYEANGYMTDNQKAMFSKCLNHLISEQRYITLIMNHIPLDMYVDGFILDFKTYEWPAQNVAARALIEVNNGDLISLSNDKLEQLGRNILQSAQGNSRGSHEFIYTKLSEVGVETPLCLIKGLLFECFVNENFCFRCKNKFLKEVLHIILKREAKDITNMLLELVEQIKKSSYEYLTDTSTMIQIINDVRGEIKSTKPDIEKLLKQLNEPIELIDKKMHNT